MLPEDATRAHLYFNSQELLKGVTRDRRGANLPLRRGSWAYQREILLGVQEPFEAGIDPEPILRGLRAKGYFVWPANSIEPFGTSQ